MPASALAQTAQLAWDPSADASGYVVRWGSAQGVYPNSVNAGAKASVEITGLIPGATYWAVVEAYNAAGVFSTPSAPVRFVALLGGGRLRRENARADFDGDGRNDLLWQHDTGALAAWTLQGGVTIKTGVDLRDRADASWRIAGTGDFNGDGKPDLVWQHRTDGWVSLWYMDGFTRIGETSLSLL
ncbi:MAG TPA: FG-GAP-like repeat-containing protein, partial [Vicinamibacterales bacterium]|nr:FG-GAP-like repeat-containing protein [Vicinamibacterales bacterium]